ncbi:sulfate ABC transporter permease subunit CysW [Pseudaquidulcibacter saccharophilus]|uniref:sulfate ABC transporter permease subunit CysW n=1 Tax=Pseudaquidulcibacter saccharophilus TaxID=2831900 RepID=UPI001EFF0D9C|nr:sulfate ABC transporter permease subunit CysW [Pseudaquidulcibacter saccharophilus]
MRRKSAKSPQNIADYTLILFAFFWMALIIFLPLASVLFNAFKGGVSKYLETFADPDAMDALKLTLLVTAIVLPLNIVFGIASAWAITRFEFVGKTILLSIIDLPFSLSPVISGLVWVLMFGAQGWFGEFLQAHDIDVIYALPGIVLATLLVTLPFVARELIPLMDDNGTDEEVAAVTLGASGWDVFFRITLPNIKWALLYGVLLCMARAMGEFGAVSVVSGHIRGLTNTLPLHIEVAYNEYNTIGAFGAATILVGLAFVTLAIKTILEWRYADELSAQHRH